MEEKSSIGEVIIDSVELRNLYEERKSRYERLVHLVSLILNSALEKNKIKIHSFKQRLKDYNSFLEKVERKRYKDPFRECTDLAGCRIVCLFLSQVDEVKKIIQEEFDIVEMTDKRSTKKFDQFGYLSLHMLVKIPKHRLDFIEYQDLNGLLCEIQVRTILQEAWAEMEHYLNYKATKEERDEALLRKIFSLAGMFEVADSTFEEINTGFSSLVKKKLDDEDSVTALHLYKFSKDYFPWFKEEWDKGQERRYYKLSEEINKVNVTSIDKVRQILDKHSSSLERYETMHKDESKKRHFAPIGLIRAAFALELGSRFDMAFGLKGYSEKIKEDLKKK